MRMERVMNFKEEQKEKVEKIEAILREYLPEANGYQSVIMEAMEYSLMAGGKRLRPMLIPFLFAFIPDSPSRLLQP